MIVISEPLGASGWDKYAVTQIKHNIIRIARTDHIAIAEMIMIEWDRGEYLFNPDVERIFVRN